MISTNSSENLPASWDDARDIPFFRITAALFTPDFCCGAGALLASYDDTSDAEPATLSPQSTGTATAAAGTEHQPAGDLIPVRVRRIA